MQRMPGMLAAAAVAAATTAGAAPLHAHDMPPPVLSEKIEWAAAPPVLPEGAQIAVLSGDPGAEGPFVLRLKLPAGYEVPPHTHSGDELITVISGAFNMGHGGTFGQGATIEMAPGAFVVVPADHPHFAWTGVETIVQIHGPVPFDIQYLDPADDPLSQ